MAHAPSKSATPHEPMTTASFNVGGAGRVGRVRERGRSAVWAPRWRMAGGESTKEGRPEV